MAEDTTKPNEGKQPDGGGDDGGGASEENQLFKAFSSKEEHDDYVNSIVEGRLKRDRESRGETREDIAAEVRQELEAEMRSEKAKEEGDYETLVTELADKVTERDDQIKKLKDQLKEAQGTTQNTSERVEALEGRLKGLIKPSLERVPEMFRGFVEEKPIEEQAAWLEKNAEKLTGPSEPIGSPASPRAAKNGGQKEADKDVAEAQRRAAFSAV